MIHTVRSHMRRGDYIPARYILDFLIEATHKRNRRSARASVRLCQDWFDYNQKIFEIMEERRIRMMERRRFREAWLELRRIVRHIRQAATKLRTRTEYAARARNERVEGAERQT